MTFPPRPGAIGRFRLDPVPPRDDPSRRLAQWRGAIASRFTEDPAFHGHGPDGLEYRYPPVHYQWNDDEPRVVLIGDAVEPAMRHAWPGSALRIGPHATRVVEVDWEPRSFTLEPAERLIRYEFRTPWVALSQENQRAFRDASPAGQRQRLDAILVGNVLSMAKSLGWLLSPAERILAAFEPGGTVTVHLREVALIGFLGTFVCNWHLPLDLALGRSVSRGFGAYVPLPTG